MKSCDDCLGSTTCAAHNLHPVLVRVYDLYDAGTTDKFDILFSLDASDEDVLERYTLQVSSACWTKAASLAIVQVVARLNTNVHVDSVQETIATARDAFARFPWSLDELVQQAPGLYALIVETSPDGAFGDAIGKRTFVKMCKDIFYA